MKKFGFGIVAIAALAIATPGTASADNQYNVCRGSLCNNDSSVNGVSASGGAGTTVREGSQGETRSADDNGVMVGLKGSIVRSSPKATLTECADPVWVTTNGVDGNTAAGSIDRAKSACD